MLALTACSTDAFTSSTDGGAEGAANEAGGGDGGPVMVEFHDRSTLSAGAGGGLTLSLPRPAQAQAGDLIVVWLRSLEAVTLTLPTAWKQVWGQVSSDCGYMDIHLAYGRIAELLPTIDLTLSTSATLDATVLAYGNAGVPSVEQQSIPLNQTSFALDPVASVVAGGAVVAGVVFRNGTSIDFPTGMTDRGKFAVDHGRVADAVLPAGGTIGGARTFTSKDANDCGFVFQLKIPPAPR